MIDRICISLNARCNQNCLYCHFSEKKNNVHSVDNEFTPEEIKQFCLNLYDYITEYKLPLFKLGIVGSGEPLLSMNSLKTLVEFFYYSEIRDVMRIYVISNGTLLNADIIDFFFFYKNIVELNISLDGDPETNARFRGASYPDLSGYEKKFGCKPRINSVVTQETLLHKTKIISFFRENNFNQINFSKIFGVNDSKIKITDDEYNAFLLYAKSFGIESRQNHFAKKYDCTKYGNLCGVGRNNVFITRTGIYPCGRFMDLKEYILGSWTDSLKIIENKMGKFIPCPDGECYYEYNEVKK